MNEIGYTPAQINELMRTIVDSYTHVGNVISDGWPAVSQTMQQYWVGEDEQSYENKFCERMCEMYTSACQIVTDLNNNLRQLGEDWHTFQQKNSLDGAASPESFPVNLENIAVPRNDKIISYKQASINDSTARGVKAGALSAIQSSMSDYLRNIKTSLQDIYSGLDASKAFIGAQQSAAINSYIEKLGNALGTVVTAANDIYTALQALTQTSYSQSEEQVSTQMNSSNVQSDIESQLGDMKWNG